MAKQYKPGEVIEVMGSQEDENGLTLHEVIFRSYGYDRETANIGSNSIVDAIQDLIKAWDQARKGGGQPPKR